MTDFLDLTAKQLLTAYASKSVSPVEILSAALGRLDRDNPAVNAFVLVDREGALQQAKASEQRWLQGNPLIRANGACADGIIATIKSNVMTKGWPARRGSTTIDETPAGFDAPVTASLRDAGCILLGQTTMPEFGWIGVTHSKLHGVTRNPWNITRTPGGSSGGAAAAAALGIGHFHVGTDAAGSIRIPCAYTGLAGIMPSLGRVPAYPASPFVPLARLGPMTRHIDDAALMLEIMARPDSRDLIATTEPAPDYRAPLSKGLRGLRIGWSVTLGYVETLDPAIQRLCETMARRLTEFGAIVEEADPGFRHDDAYKPLRVLWDAGCAHVLKGVRPEQMEAVDSGFRRCAGLGERLSAKDVMQAMADRAALYETMRRYHERYDVLLTPTMPTTAIEAGVEVPSDGSFGTEWFNWSPYTWPFNLTGQPAASVPIGLVNGMPVGLQVVAPLGREDSVLRVAKGVEMLSAFGFLEGARQ